MINPDLFLCLKGFWTAHSVDGCSGQAVLSVHDVSRQQSKPTFMCVQAGLSTKLMDAEYIAE